MTAPPRVQLRRMTSPDVVAVVAIEALVFPSPWSAATFDDLLTRQAAGAELWVVHDERAGVVGYAVLWCILDQAELANIAVHPDFRRMGLGALLLGHALSVAEDRGAESIFLEVRSSNEGAAALYRRFGFRDVGLRRDYYDRPREDARVMRADL